MARQTTKDDLTLLYEVLVPVLSRASVGSFDDDIEIDPGNPERLNELLMGVQVLLEVIREKTAELEAVNLRLSDSRDRSVNLLDEVLRKSLD